MSREQDKLQCKECIKKLKKKLEENGFNILKVNDDILIKTPRRSVLNRNISTSSSSHSCPVNAAGAIKNGSCTCSGICNIESKNCPICNGTANSGNNTSNSTNTSGSVCLFRIRPTDIYNGIFLHAITLYNEECDLKMTFGYDTEAINQIMAVLNFLV